MSAPDPEGMSVLSKILAAGAPIVVAVWGARTWLEKRFAKKIDQEDFKEFIARFDKHCDQDRETQAKLFDKCDEIKTLLIERVK
jgi:hypothetical protein